MINVDQFARECHSGIVCDLCRTQIVVVARCLCVCVRALVRVFACMFSFEVRFFVCVRSPNLKDVCLNVKRGVCVRLDLYLNEGKGGKWEKCGGGGAKAAANRRFLIILCCRWDARRFANNRGSVHPF